MTIAFDSGYYLLAYPDVAAAVVKGQFADAYTHYVLFGARELRNPNAQFNAAEYAGLYPDVANAVSAGVFRSVWDHYVSFGLAEGRAPSVALQGFNAAQYLAIHTDVAAAVNAGMFKSALEHYLLAGQAEGRTWGEDIALTNGTDKLVANKFVAALVQNPGGTDRINSLQDEDELTGIGVNPTLTATLGNANDNGGTVITPVLKGIETVNVAFTGSGGGTGAVQTLDLQDSTGLTKAVNITRITDGLDVTIRNLASVPAELSVANTHSPANNVSFTFLASATAGTADATQLTLSNAQIGALTVQAHNGATGVETINLVSKGSANTVGTLTAQDLQTLTISGDQDFTLTNTTNVITKADSSLVEATVYTDGLLNVAGSLSKIDGSAATGNLTLNLGGIFTATKDGTSGTDIAVEVLGGKGNDTFILTDDLGANDKIDGGEGKNTVVLTNGNIVGTAANVQTLDIRANVAGAINVDTSKLAQLETVVVRNEGYATVGADLVASAKAVVVNLNKLTTAVAENAGITVKHGTSLNNDIASLTVNANLATATGTNDTVVFNIANGVNTDARFNVTLGAANVENITLNDNDTESNTVALTNHGQHTGTITLKGGVAGQFLNLDYAQNSLRKATDGTAGDGVGIVTAVVADNAGALVASVINAEAHVGDVIVRVSTSDAAISALGAQTVKLGSGNDTLIFNNLADSRAGLTISDTVSGGAGSDTLAIGGNVAVNLGASEWTNVTGFETIRLLGNGATYTLALTDELITRNAADGKIINIVNDNDPDNDAVDGLPTGVDAVSAVTIDARALAVGLNFNYNGEEGGDRTADRFIFVDRNMNSTAVIDGGAVDNDAATNSPANDDVIEIRNAAVIAAGDLQNIKNVGTIEMTNDTAVLQEFTLQLNDTIVDAMVDSYHTSTVTASETLNVTSKDNTVLGAAHTALLLQAAELTARSNLNVNSASGHDRIFLGAGADTVHAGAGNDSIEAGAGNDSIMGEDGHDTILGEDGDDYLSGGAGNDSIDGGNGNDTIDGGTGNDSITGGEGHDSIDGGDGEDTISGGNGNDTINGGNGADSIDGGDGHDSINGGDGADSLLGGNGNDTIDGGDGADTINGGDGADSLLGGAGADSISGGDGNDTIVGGAGDDTLNGGDGVDRFVFGETAASNGVDTITDFTVGAGGDILDFSGFDIDWTITPAVPGSINIHTVNPGVTDASGQILRLVGANLDTAVGLNAALGLAGSFQDINMGNNQKAIFITSATDGNDADYIFFATSDVGGNITTTLVATLTGNIDIDNYTTTNFLI